MSELWGVYERGGGGGGLGAEGMDIDSKEGKLKETAMEKFCQDIEINPNDVEILYLCFKMNSAEFGAIAKAEFVKAWTAIG